LPIAKTKVVEIGETSLVLIEIIDEFKKSQIFSQHFQPHILSESIKIKFCFPLFLLPLLLLLLFIESLGLVQQEWFDLKPMILSNDYFNNTTILNDESHMKILAII